MTYMDIAKAVLAKVEYKGWSFNLIPINGDENGDLFLQVSFMAPDNVTQIPELQTGRKWLVQFGTHPTQIVQAAWLAVQRAEMHEIAEQFRYKGATIYNRHIDVDALVEASNRMD